MAGIRHNDSINEDRGDDTRDMVEAHIASTLKCITCNMTQAHTNLFYQLTFKQQRKQWALTQV